MNEVTANTHTATVTVTSGGSTYGLHGVRPRFTFSALQLRSDRLRCVHGETFAN